MIVALSAVACVMVVIGLGLVVQGTPFTRLEWGWTMVLAGTVTATGGILLAGIAVLAARLGALERALRHGAATRQDPAPPVASPLAGTAHLPPMPPVLPVAEAPLVPSRVGDEAVGARGGAVKADERAILAAGDLLGEPADAPLGPVARVLPAEEVSGVPEVEPPAPAPKPAEPAPPTVVGTYASGGNAYVMYSDGSIKADTPKGHFTFGSLDELKAFIAEGGEAETPPAVRA
jgi:hypothetical protein